MKIFLLPRTTRTSINAKSFMKSDDTFSDDEDNRLEDGSGQGPIFGKNAINL